MIIRIALIVALLIPAVVNAQQGKYLSPEQEREIDRRSSARALDDLFGNPDLVYQGIIRKEKLQETTYLPLQPPSRKTVAKFKVKNNHPEIKKIYIYPNQVTVLTITDSLGEPWPLSAEPIVPSQEYNVNHSPDIPGFITVETSSKFVPSSLVLPLKGKLRPVHFELTAINELYNYAVEVTVEGRSPLNTIAVERPFGGVSIPEHDEYDIQQFLGSPPEDARKILSIGDQRVAAWSWRGMVVVRAPYQLIDPSNYIDVQSDIDNEERVYLLTKNLEVASFLNTSSSKTINVEFQGIE